MAVRWRLGVLAFQLCVLGVATFAAEGRAYSASTWFMSGILAVVINPQLWEPYFSRPADVLGNALLAGLLVLTTSKAHALPGWNALSGFLAVFALMGLVALVFGADRTGRLAGLGRFASIVCRVASGRAIYSAVFFLSLLETTQSLSNQFWLLAGTWVLILISGSINWQGALAAAAGRPGPCAVVGLVGPATLLVEAPTLPMPGTHVRIRAEGLESDGFVGGRIARGSDVWGELHLLDSASGEALLRAHLVTLSLLPSGPDLVGTVAAGSTHLTLRFFPPRALEIGQVVSVASSTGEVLYQVRSAAIEQSTVKGGAHLVVEAHASHLGVFDHQTLRLLRHRWVPPAGSAVQAPSVPAQCVPPPFWLQLGNLRGTKVPLYVDCTQLCEGHGVILGMTRMGKTSLAVRIAQKLAESARVIVVDQTGEYVSKRGLPRYAPAADDSTIGLSVLEPAVGSIAPDVALKHLRAILGLAQAEYLAGAPLRRVLLIDEAHQFIPEPALMGFNAIGRDSAAQFGQLMMQVRKFGISALLISQRTAVVAKSALSQCENVIAFKSVDQTGLDYLEEIAGAEARKLLPTLEQGQALIFGPAMSCDSPAVVDVSH